MSDEEPAVPSFLIARGGPFFEAQRRIGLVRRDSLRPATRAFVLVAMTWGIPFLMTLAAGTAFGSAEARPYLLDPGVWARFGLAVVLLVLAEGQIEQRLRVTIEQFFAIPMVTTGDTAKAHDAVARALRRRDSVVAEIICGLIAVVISGLIIRYVHDQENSSWALTIGADGTRSMTFAAIWVVLVSNTIFWFLMLRAFWRHIIWALLLNRLARLRLRLVAAHPDKHGGLGFIGLYPTGYISFIIALSGVVAGALAHQIMHDTLTAKSFGVVAGVWLALVYVYFGIPLAAFGGQLMALKERARLAASRQATIYQRQQERKTIGTNVAPDDHLSAESEAELADPAKFYEATGKVSPLIVTRSTLVPVSAAALVPLVVVGVSQLPLQQLMPVIKRLLLL